MDLDSRLKLTAEAPYAAVARRMLNPWSSKCSQKYSTPLHSGTTTSIWDFTEAGTEQRSAHAAATYSEFLGDVRDALALLKQTHSICCLGACGRLPALVFARRLR